MTLDLLDRAFLDRWHALPAVPRLVATQPEPEPDAVAANAAPVAPVGAAIGPAIATTAAIDADAIDADAIDADAIDADAIDADAIDGLLRAAWAEWSAVADEVEAARGRGRRVIAVVACERDAGTSTLVEGLVRLLRRRGRDAVAAAGGDVGLPAAGPTHDRRIVLVDAGVWFPPGRIHRQRVAVASTGCDAAILVRPADREPPAAWSAVLEAIGVEPLGEVVSFAPPHGGATAAEDSP